MHDFVARLSPIATLQLGSKSIDIPEKFSINSEVQKALDRNRVIAGE